MTYRKLLPIILLLFLSVGSAACGRERTAQETWEEAAKACAGNHNISKELVYDHSLNLKYAKGFAVDYYQDGFTLVSISDGSLFLIHPSQSKIPDDIDENIVILEKPLKNIYLAASATMDMFCAMNAMDSICLSGIKQENWQLEQAVQAMRDGSIVFAGRYNAPDYETILSRKCSLAIESTMILHAPDVKEKLLSFGIPVLVDRSSYEEHPLGRMEWVKCYGALTGHDEEAEEAYEKQLEAYETLGEVRPTGKTVVFFYITNQETVVVRKSSDYVSKMIELAGGEYLFQNLEQTGASSSVNMQMEEFLAKAKDADYLVYNSTVDGELMTIEDLLAKSIHLKNFKAVQEHQVWCATQNVYQETMSAGRMIKEFYEMLTTGGNENEPTRYLYKLD